jgi:hypothetical protein
MPTCPPIIARQALRDGQPQAGAAETPRGRRVGLHEGREQLRLRIGCDADAGVDHPEAQHQVVSVLASSSSTCTSTGRGR